MPRSHIILGAEGSPFKKRFSSFVKHDMLPEGNYLFAAIATVDSSWEHKRPTSSPNIDPVSHIVRARTKPNYTVQNAGVKIVGGVKWFSRPRCYKITPDEMIHHKTDKQPVVNPHKSNNEKEREDNFTKIMKDINETFHKLENEDWRQESIDLMKKAMADTLVAIAVMLVLAIIAFSPVGVCTSNIIMQNIQMKRFRI